MPGSRQKRAASVRKTAPVVQLPLDAEQCRIGREALRKLLLRWEAEHRDRLREHPIPAQELRITY